LRLLLLLLLQKPPLLPLPCRPLPLQTSAPMVLRQPVRQAQPCLATAAAHAPCRHGPGAATRCRALRPIVGRVAVSRAQVARVRLIWSLARAD
jgi:hypothetical protein